MAPPVFAPLELSLVDPLSPAAMELVALLSRELAERYDFVDDGAGKFSPEDVRVPASGFIVGRVNGKPVACGAFRPMEPGVCEIKRMFVVPEFRGRGYARQLLAEVERQAANSGYTTARLETGDRQPEAIALYERAGYQRIPKYGPYEDNVHSVCFERQLGARASD